MRRKNVAYSSDREPKPRLDKAIYMNQRRFAVFFLLLSAAYAQRPDPAALISEQKKAMAALSFMDGVWRGSAWTLMPNGQKHNITQTERIGPFLDGSVKVIEGRGYETDGKVGFNAFGTISYDVAKKAYTMRSHAMGVVGDFPFKPTADGYVWELPAGPNATVRYTAVLKNGTFVEIGEMIRPGKEPMKTFEMSLQRIGDSDWPAAGAVAPK